MGQTSCESTLTSYINHGILTYDIGLTGHYKLCISIISTKRRSHRGSMGLKWSEVTVTLHFHCDVMFWRHLPAHLHMIIVQQNTFRDRKSVNYCYICTAQWFPNIFYTMWRTLRVEGDGIWAKIPWFGAFWFGGGVMADGAIYLKTG